MSLINEMLRNIEAKRPDDLARQNLQREIRSLPSAPQGHGRLFGRLLLALGLSLALGLAALQATGQLPSLLGAEPAPVAEVKLPVVPALPVPPPAVPAVDLQPDLFSDKLRLAQDLSILPMPAPAVPEPTTPIAQAPLVPAGSAVESAKVAAAVPVGPVKIEKSPVLATPRDRADADYRRAEAASAAGHPAEALDALRAALRQDPAYVQVRQALLRQLLEQRKLDEAMKILQEGLEAQPAQTGWAMSLARLQLEQGDPAAAERTLARSQGYADNSADYAGFQGHLKSSAGAHRQAAQFYLRATQLAASEGRWWLGLGLALQADGKLSEAKEALRRALATGTLSHDLAEVAQQQIQN